MFFWRRRCSLRTVRSFSCDFRLLNPCQSLFHFVCHLFVRQQSAPVDAGRQVDLVELSVQIPVGGAVFGPALVQVTHTTDKHKSTTLLLSARPLEHHWCLRAGCDVTHSRSISLACGCWSFLTLLTSMKRSFSKISAWDRFSAAGPCCFRAEPFRSFSRSWSQQQNTHSDKDT